MKFGTKVIHGGLEPDPTTGAVMTPIYQTSTYAQARPGAHKGFEYSRSANPTRQALEKNLAVLESGHTGLAFGSGLAALDAILKLLQPGDEVISTNDLYGGSYRIFTRIFEAFGFRFTFLNLRDLAAVEAAITPQTKLIWAETPTNPMMNILDIAGLAALSQKHGVMLGVDNTFATPFLQNPLDLGADVVLHSVTKYLAGHSDVVMGALVTKTAELGEKLAFIQNSSGAVPGPQDCFLTLRGIKTLHVRMERHCRNAREVAAFLRRHAKVGSVHYPGFEDHPDHALAQAQMRDFGGIVTFTVKDADLEATGDVMARFRVITLAESLGGVESLAVHPATMTHGAIPREERTKTGILDNTIRLSVGIEDIDDLLADLAQALA